MANELRGRKVAFLATDGVDERELVEPWKALEEAGAEVTLVSTQTGKIQAVKGLDKTATFPVGKTVQEVQATDFDALVLPGGTRNPDRLRIDEKAVEFVRGFMEADKPVAAICHAPWVLVEADAVAGRTLTSFRSLKTDIENAGGSWVDKPVEVDQKLITSRGPDDLPAFCGKLVAVIGSAIDERQLDKTIEQSFPASDPSPGPISLA